MMMYFGRLPIQIYGEGIQGFYWEMKMLLKSVLDNSTEITRTGYGRSLAIQYGPLTNWAMYIESIAQSWINKSQSFDLTNLFPDFENPELKTRKIDSLVFMLDWILQKILFHSNWN